VAFDTVDLHFLRELREARSTNGGKAEGALLTRELELETMHRSDLTIVCSSFERELLRYLDPRLQIQELSLIHEEDRSRVPPAERSGLLFVGGFEHPPNADAVIWFATEILPLITARVPTRLHVVGSSAPEQVLELASDNVSVHGYLESLDPLYDAVRVTVAPLRFGAGVKGKVIHSLMKGVPVVGTSVAVEGTPLVPGRHVAVADTAAAFAEEVALLLEDDTLWQELADRGRAIAEERYGLPAARAELHRLLERAVSRPAT
jgi:glycosyltransferase involved in cell wall biosynthesis